MLEPLAVTEGPVPQFEDRARMWAELEIDERAAPEAVADYCAHLRLAYSNGEVRFQTFHIAPHRIFDWYASRNQFHELGFFGKIWAVPPINALMPEPPLDLNFYSTNVFSQGSPFLLGGALAGVLADGGAYSGHGQGAVHAKQVGDAAGAALICDRYEDLLCYAAHMAWSSFFHDVAWDRSWVVVDKRERLVHILCATDTD